MILTDYIYIFTYLIISIVLAVIIYTLSYLIAIQKADNEKVSPYECGFNPFDDARNEFEVRFYLVASVTNQLNN
jgi:NADH-quinone oxidoreductase subunit A